MPRGGARPGAGAKPKNRHLRSFDGGAAHRQAPTVPILPTATAQITEFDAPNSLTTDERLIWLELAPFAFKKRTLTPATSLAFCLLCRNILLERQFATSVNDKGNANHRGMIQRVDAELTAFDLRPMGKPIYEAEPEDKKQPEQKRAYW